MLTAIADIVGNYKNFLGNKYPKRFKAFGDLLASQPASARAEAVTFYFFRDRVDEVQIEEDPDKGGVDFRCVTRKSEFVVEVTHLEDESISQASGLKNEIPEKTTVRSFCWITHLLRTTVSGKADQMSGYCCPRILVITSEHVYANDLLSSKIASKFLLTSDTSIPITNPEPEQDLVLQTCLEDSVFFRSNKQNNDFESCRQSISAILLCSIHENAMEIVGILHPDPVHKFPIRFLPTIPFVKLNRWPPKNNKIKPEWVTHKQAKLTPTGSFRWYY